MNASIYDPGVVQALRRELLSEHLHVDTGAMEDTAALRLCSETARANTRRHQCGDPVWQGIAFAWSQRPMRPKLATKQGRILYRIAGIYLFEAGGKKPEQPS
jgi:hypothetical protein